MNYEAYLPPAARRSSARGPLSGVCRSRAQGRRISPGHASPPRAAPARSPSGARTTISAWASTRSCWRRCTRRSTAAAPAPAARATSPAPTTIMCCWRRNWPTCTARKRRCCSPRAMSRTGPSLEHAGVAAAGLRRAVRRRQSRLDDRGHPPQPRREAHLRPQRSATIWTASCRDLDPARAEAGGVRVGLFDGRRHRADRRALRRRRRPRRDDLSRRGARASACTARAAAASPSARA